MSRCFPYPPPGYAGKVARTEAALIESIKLQSERQQSKHDRKKEKSKHKHRKERSEKSRDKKQRRKERKEKSSRGCDLNDQKQAKELLKGTKVEAEQVEKSGLTEEHGQPVWPQSPGYLSDGTQINHKRKRDAGLQPNEGCKAGKIIRIKLGSSLSNQEDSSADTQQTSTSGRYNCVDQKRDESISHGPIQQKTCFTNSDSVVAVEEAAPKPKIIEHSRAIHPAKDILRPRTRSPAESAYEALFEKWAPPPLQLEQQTDDEEWLFGKRRQDRQTTNTIPTTNKAFSPVPSCRSSSLWPRGQYLPDADVYSLPYTIPF